ncbi:hypothetical protein M2263_004504 [Providencia alcalifaciens]|nr:hypothetical protein [Providencia alcalifaciens]
MSLTENNYIHLEQLLERFGELRKKIILVEIA